jgi:ssDNA-binding Zn-finger/Zn-ribbon topoisomerase 1
MAECKRCGKTLVEKKGGSSGSFHYLGCPDPECKRTKPISKKDGRKGATPPVKAAPKKEATPPEPKPKNKGWLDDYL